MAQRIGVHLGLGQGYEEALSYAKGLGCTTAQIFTHSPRMFAFKPLDKKRQQVLLDGWKEQGIHPVVSHASYLINVGSKDNARFHGALGVLQKEIDYAAAFGCQYVVLHVGKYTDGTKEESVAQIVKAISKLSFPEGVTLLLETAAGQGTEIGRTFEELQEILGMLSADTRSRLGVCLDTCHIFAAGYDIRTPAAVSKVIEDIQRTIGIDTVRIIHVNDSKGGLGDKKDRHEHLGKGQIGAAGLKAFLTHPRIKGKPMILETPIDDAGSQSSDMDALRRIVG